MAEMLRWLRQSKCVVEGGIPVVGVDGVDVGIGSVAVNCGC